MTDRIKILNLEAGDSKAIVSLLDHDASVGIEVADGKIYILVKVDHGKDASSWDEHRYECDLYRDDDE